MLVLCLSACASSSAHSGADAADSAPPATTTADTIARALTTRPATASIDGLLTVAERAYVNQVSGPAAQKALRRIEANPAVRADLTSGNVAALRAYVLPQFKRVWYHWHVSRLRIWSGSSLLVDVGVPFVVAPSQRSLRDAHRRTIGTLQVSMQDEIGFVRLMHRRYGADVAVSGRGGRDFVTSLHISSSTPLPLTGTTTVAGQRYAVRSFNQMALAGERVTIWILKRA